MKEIIHHKYTLFALEKRAGFFSEDYMTSEDAFIFLETCDTLEEAQFAQKEYKQKTIILSSW